MLGNEAHFGAGCGCATLDLVPDRLDQGDTGYKDRLLVILKFVFGSRLPEKPALCQETAADAGANTRARQQYTTGSGTETDDRAQPVKLCRGRRRTGE